MTLAFWFMFAAYCVSFGLYLVTSIQRDRLRERVRRLEAEQVLVTLECPGCRSTISVTREMLQAAPTTFRCVRCNAIGTIDSQPTGTREAS